VWLTATVGVWVRGVRAGGLGALFAGRLTRGWCCWWSSGERRRGAELRGGGRECLQALERGGELA
jgi:hypothetical protein